MRVEYRIKPVIRYIVTEYKNHGDNDHLCQAEELGEFQNFYQANIVHRALVASSKDKPTHVVYSDSDSLQACMFYYAYSEEDAKKHKEHCEATFVATWKIKKISEGHKKYFSGPTYVDYTE